MRQTSLALCLALAAGTVFGCTPQALFPGSDYDGDLLNTIVTAGESSAVATDGASDGSANGEATPETAGKTVFEFDGTVTGNDGYQLFDLGPGSAGDRWHVTAGGPLSSPFIVVLLDGDQNLLMRTYFYYRDPLDHILRQSSDNVYVGIMPPASGDGGSFQLRATRQAYQPIPTPQRQVVWLNFAGGVDVKVHTRDPVSFPPFDGATIGEAYADHTREMADMILSEMRADYAGYNVEILSSVDGQPPEGPYATIHFGGDEPGLLGLADGVDNYNQDPAQSAMVYVPNFAPYWTMHLEPDEMAVMIANVASHELGHLLGLYHTKNPDDLMDTTGSAWDLADNQSFVRAELEPTVFATGWEDSPVLLGQIIGYDPDAAKTVVRQKSAKSATYKAIRQFAQQELTSTCGTCLSLDHE